MKVATCLLCLAAAVAVDAQEPPIAGPNAGIIFDGQSRSIRWILGVPGAAYLGPAFSVAHRTEGSVVRDGRGGRDIDLARVSPNGKLVLAVKEGALHLAHFDGGWEWLGGSARALAWGEDCSTAVVYGEGVALWRNLGRGVPERIALAGVDGAEWSSFAVEPGGDAVLAAGSAGVYRLASAEARLLVSTELSPALAPALALDTAGEVLYVTDRAAGAILAIRNWRNSPEIASFTVGIEDPVALSMSADGRALLVASGSGRMIAEYDLGTAARTREWALDFVPTRLERLSSGMFALNARGSASEPLQVLAGGAVWFIPAPAF